MHLFPKTIDSGLCNTPCDTFGNCFDTSSNTVKHSCPHSELLLSMFRAIVKYA